MIREARQEDIPACVEVVRRSFKTVADEFGFTEENAPRFTAFATDEGRLNYHMMVEKRPTFVSCDGEKIVGYCSLMITDGGECELSNLSVLPEYRHGGIGRQLTERAEVEAKKLGCKLMKLGIVEENTVLRAWYESLGFVHTGTEKFDFFPFTCGYLEKRI